MLRALFYARFHPDRGPSVIHQYPSNSIVSKTTHEKVLFNFSNISSYIIPPYDLCNLPLSICSEGHRILGFPVSLEHAKYARNRFTFNICFVVDEDDDARPWEQIVEKTARFFTAVEEEDGILQAEEVLDGLKWADEDNYPAQDVGVVYTLLEAIVEDLNAYGEACVRIDDLHVLNLRLVAAKATPPKVKAWDVPLLIRPLPSPDEWTWDLALQHIHPHLDGVKHVQKISELADVELQVVAKAIRELLYHGRVVLLDIFHFQAIYAPTEDFAFFVKDQELQDECRKYIGTDPTKNIFKSATGSQTVLTNGAIINLYRNFTPGLTLHDFCLMHEPQLSNIDIRRFVTFGILKGFLRRIQRYALAIDPQTAESQAKLSSSDSAFAKSKAAEVSMREMDEAYKKAAHSSGWSTPPPHNPATIEDLSQVDDVEGGRSDEDEKLRKFLDGKHCFDEICVSMHLSERKVVERLWSGRFGKVVVFCK